MTKNKGEKKGKAKSTAASMPSAEEVAAALGKAESTDDFFGKEGIFAELFGKTIEGMMEAELSEHLGYERYESKGRNSGNNRNGHYEKKLRSSVGETRIQVPRDREGEFEPEIVEKYQANTSELEERIIALYARGQSARDIADHLAETYGANVDPKLISRATDKVWPLVEEWQSRPLQQSYPIVYLDAMHVKIRRDGKVENLPIYIVLAVDLEGHRDVLGHWIGEGPESANFWLSVLTDLQNRGVEDILIASVDGLSGFEDAIGAVFPQTQIQLCIVHQVRNSLKYVSWKDRKDFVRDLKTVYRAATREAAEAQLDQIEARWSEAYPIAIRSWRQRWDGLSTYFDYPPEIRRLIYTTNPIEGYHRQLRKVIKTKGSFPSPAAARKLLFLVNRNVTAKWSMTMTDWPKILNQLAIRFDGRIQV